jgi:hypothetical protein
MKTKNFVVAITANAFNAAMPQGRQHAFTRFTFT